MPEKPTSDMDIDDYMLCAYHITLQIKPQLDSSARRRDGERDGLQERLYQPASAANSVATPRAALP
jgi:hypothetical protein